MRSNRTNSPLLSSSVNRAQISPAWILSTKFLSRLEDIFSFFGIIWVLLLEVLWKCFFVVRNYACDKCKIVSFYGFFFILYSWKFLVISRFARFPVSQWVTFAAGNSEIPNQWVTRLLLGCGNFPLREFPTGTPGISNGNSEIPNQWVARLKISLQISLIHFGFLPDVSTTTTILSCTAWSMLMWLLFGGVISTIDLPSHRQLARTWFSCIVVASCNLAMFPTSFTLGAL